MRKMGIGHNPEMPTVKGPCSLREQFIPIVLKEKITDATDM
jgi:hypothetical protein